MAVMTPRESWTDERLDDLKGHMDEGFRDVKAELRQQRNEMARQKDVDVRFEQLNRTMQIGFGIIGGVMTGMLGLLGVIVTKL